MGAYNDCINVLQNEIYPDAVVKMTTDALWHGYPRNDEVTCSSRNNCWGIL